jgi:hypothetical protein
MPLGKKMRAVSIPKRGATQREQSEPLPALSVSGSWTSPAEWRGAWPGGALSALSSPNRATVAAFNF